MVQLPWRREARSSTSSTSSEWSRSQPRACSRRLGASMSRRSASACASTCGSSSRGRTRAVGCGRPHVPRLRSTLDGRPQQEEDMMLIGLLPVVWSAGLPGSARRRGAQTSCGAAPRDGLARRSTAAALGVATPRQRPRARHARRARSAPHRDGPAAAAARARRPPAAQPAVALALPAAHHPSLCACVWLCCDHRVKGTRPWAARGASTPQEDGAGTAG